MSNPHPYKLRVYTEGYARMLFASSSWDFPKRITGLALQFVNLLILSTFALPSVIVIMASESIASAWTPSPELQEKMRQDLLLAQELAEKPPFMYQKRGTARTHTSRRGKRGTYVRKCVRLFR